MADDDELSAEELAVRSNRAAEVYGLVAAIVKQEDQAVIGAVLGSLLAAYLSTHDFEEQMDTLQRLLLLTKNILRDINMANGIQDQDGVQFQFVYEDGVREEMDKDPKMAEFVRDQTSRVRQALSDYQAGKYQSIDEAMQAVGLSHVDADQLEEITERLGTPRKPS